MITERTCKVESGPRRTGIMDLSWKELAGNSHGYVIALCCRSTCLVGLGPTVVSRRGLQEVVSAQFFHQSIGDFRGAGWGAEIGQVSAPNGSAALEIDQTELEGQGIFQGNPIRGAAFDPACASRAKVKQVRGPELSGRCLDLGVAVDRFLFQANLLALDIMSVELFDQAADESA